MAYGHIYNQTTHLCQCGSYDCFSDSLASSVCLDGRCGCSEDVDKCDRGWSYGIDVCVGGICENQMGKLIEVLPFT